MDDPRDYGVFHGRISWSSWVRDSFGHVRRKMSIDGNNNAFRQVGGILTSFKDTNLLRVSCYRLHVSVKNHYRFIVLVLQRLKLSVIFSTLLILFLIWDLDITKVVLNLNENTEQNYKSTCSLSILLSTKMYQSYTCCIHLCRFGRRLTIMISFVLSFTATFGLAWTSSFVVFCILRFIIGAAAVGSYVTGFVLGKL